MPIAPTSPTTGSQNIAFAHDNAPWKDGDWCFIAWLRPYSDQSAAHIFRLSSSLSLAVQRFDSGRFQVGYNGSPSNFSVRPANQTIANNEWVLLAATFDSTSKSLTVYVQSESGSKQANSQTIASFVAASSTSAQFFVTGAFTPFDGEACYVIRNHQLAQADFDLLWSRKKFSDLLAGNYHASIFLNMPGPTDSSGTTPIILSHGLCMSAVPTDDVTGSPTLAYPGEALASTNVVCYDRADATSPTSFTVAREVSAVADLEYTDLDTGFFNLNPPGIFTGDQQVSGYAPLTRLLADNQAPSGVKRLVVPSNSRGVRTSQSAVSASGALFYGLQQVRTSLVAGVTACRADGVGAMAVPKGTTNSGGSLSTNNYSRAGTFGASANPGPGNVYLLSGVGDYRDMLWAELTGSRYLASAAITARAALLKLPGGPTAQYWAATASTSGGTRTLGSVQTVDLDNATAEATIVSVSGMTTTVSGDVTGDINAGDIVTGMGPTTGGGINQVVSALFNGTNTEITTRFTWDTAPSASDVVRFGPLEYVVVSVAHAGGAGTYRGIRVGFSTDAGPLPVPIVQWQTWITDGDGFAMGGFGCGGEGWTPQLDESFAGVVGKLIAALEIDLTMDFPAQQDTVGSAITTWLDAMKADSPNLEQVLCGDIRHAQPGQDDATGYVGFHSAMRSAAQSRGLAFATVMEDPTVGSGWDFLARAWNDDTAHPTEEGNEAMLAGVLAKFQTAALATQPGSGGGFLRNRSRRVGYQRRPVI